MNKPWLPNEIWLEIFKFVLSPPDVWKLNWRNISAVSKQWNQNSWIAFYASIPKVERIILFIQACECGHLYYVQQTLLLDKKIDPSTNYNEAIRYASKWGHIEVVKLLLQDKRVDPFVWNNCAIR